MALSRSKKVRQLIGNQSRDASALRRAPFVPAKVERVPESEAPARRRLIGHELAHARAPGDRRLTKRLDDYRSRLNTDPARSHIVRELNEALFADGGRFLRVCARAAPNVVDAAATSVESYILQRREHGVKAASATSLLMRSCLAAAVADALMAQVIEGTATEGQTKLAASMSTSARLDMLTALQLQKSADDAARSAPTWGNWPPRSSAAEDEAPPLSEDAPLSDDRAEDEDEPAPMAIGRPGPSWAPPALNEESHREALRGETKTLEAEPSPPGHREALRGEPADSIWIDQLGVRRNSQSRPVDLPSAIDPSPEVRARIAAAEARAVELHTELRDKERR